MNLNYRLRDSDIPTDTGSNSSCSKTGGTVSDHCISFFLFFKVRYSKLSIPYACNCKSSNSCDLVLECGTRFLFLERNGGEGGERKKNKHGSARKKIREAASWLRHPSAR